MILLLGVSGNERVEAMYVTVCTLAMDSYSGILAPHYKSGRVPLTASET